MKSVSALIAAACLAPAACNGPRAAKKAPAVNLPEAAAAAPTPAAVAQNLANLRAAC